MTDSTSSLRPYYNPDGFHSPGYSNDHELGVFVTSYTGGESSSVGGLTSRLPDARTLDRIGGDYNYDYLTEVNASENISQIGLSMIRLYSRVFVAQPFEVSRLLLQVGDWQYNTTRRISPVVNTSSKPSFKGHDESDEEVDYFTSTDDLTSSRDLSRRANDQSDPTHTTNGVPQTTETSNKKLWKDRGYTETIDSNSVHVFDVISALNTKDGVRGLWRGVHTSFLLDALTATIEAWLSGFISAVVGISDPLFVDVLHSPNPVISLAISTAASVATAVILSPIDIIRTKFVVTTFQTGPRSLRQSIVRLKSFTSPTIVALPTALYAGLPTLINKGTPYFLHNKFGVDSYKNPTWYNILSLCSSLIEISVKMPLETLVRRAHVAYLNLPDKQLIVAPVPYSGFFGSFWNVLIGSERIESYYMGWRVSIMGMIGDWGVGALQNDDKTKERF